MGIVVILLIPFFRSLSVEDIVNFTPDSLLLAVLVFLLLYTIKPCVIFFPIAVLYVSAGLTFPIGWAIIVTYCGLAIMTSIGYMIGSKLGKNKINKLLGKQKKVANFLNKKKDNLVMLCFVSRVLPLPVNMCNMFYGAIKMPFPKYLLVSLVGMSPTMLPIVFAGANLTNPLSPEFIIPFAISLSIAIIAFVIYRANAKLF